MSDLTKAGLKGPVKVCSTERRSFLWSDTAMALPRTELLELSRESFDVKGNILERWQRNAIGTEWVMASEYDQAGKLLERRYSGIRPGSDQAFWRFFYAYDSQGRIEYVTARSLKGGSRVCESYQYGPNGESETILYPDPALDRSLGSDVSDFNSSPDAIAIATRLNQSGQPLERIFYGSNHGVIRRVLFRYDSVGNLIEEGEAESADSIRTDFRRVYLYDKAQRLTKVEVLCYAFGSHTDVLSYNDNGDVMERNTVIDEGILSTLEPHHSLLRYAYRYDQHDNWIEKITQTRALPALSFEDTNVECRELSYH